jgi:hypothetical protein
MVSLVGGHARPLPTGCVKIDRVVVFWPVPHVTLQAPHWSHAPTMQSTGHGAVWHGAESVIAGHAIPPHICHAVIWR